MSDYELKVWQGHLGSISEVLGGIDFDKKFYGGAYLVRSGGVHVIMGSKMYEEFNNLLKEEVRKL